MNLTLVLCGPLAAFAWAGATLQAQIHIDSFSRNGTIRWSSPTNGLQRFRVEWAPSLGGPWFSSWQSLSDIPPSNTTFTAMVPMFYRVVADVKTGEICATAETIGAGEYTGTTSGFTNDLAAAAGCAGTGGPDRFYSVQIPPGQKLLATLEPVNAAFDPSLNLMVNCSGGCAAGVDAGGAGLTEVLQYSNPALVPLQVWLVVGSTQAGAAGAGPFNLTIQFQPLPAGDLCLTAPALTPNLTLNGQTTAAYQNDFSATAACVGTACPGPDRFYAIGVPAGQRLIVTVTPTSGWDPAVYVLAGCGVAACLAGADNAGGGEPEAVSYLNTTGAAQTLIIGVDSYAAGSSGGFSISTSVGP